MIARADNSKSVSVYTTGHQSEHSSDNRIRALLLKNDFVIVDVQAERLKSVGTHNSLTCFSQALYAPRIPCHP
jgi:hypothetical protein